MGKQELIYRAIWSSVAYTVTNARLHRMIASVMCGCPLRVKVDELRWVERTGAVMCPASDAAGLAAGPDELRGASAGSM